MHLKLTHPSSHKLSLYARNLRPMLREAAVEEDEIDLSHVVMSHYRLSKIRQQDIKLKKNTDDGQLEPGEGLGTAKPKDRTRSRLRVNLTLSVSLITTALSLKDR